ncbi:MAG: Asp23/Gls24 family envelope stress response protein [Trueperaceae bacterium]|nr:MAG: Asp23/Gls24 family envelope stress response protein [Trueperaceae bacterium]
MTDPKPQLELSHDVLYGIAQLALDEVEGVRPIAPPARVGEFLTGRRAKGIQIEREGNEVDVSLTVAMSYGAEIPKVAKRAQKSVREAVASMTGLHVRSVDVFVEAVDVPPAIVAADRAAAAEKPKSGAKPRSTKARSRG